MVPEAYLQPQHPECVEGLEAVVGEAWAVGRIEEQQSLAPAGQPIQPLIPHLRHSSSRRRDMSEGFGLIC